MKNKLKSIAKISLAVAIVFFMIKQGALDLHELTTLFVPSVFLICCLFMTGTMLLTALRFQILLVAEDLKLSFWEALQLTLIGNFFNFAIVGGVGGDLVKGYLVTKKFSHAKMASALCVLMDRVIGLFTMVIMAFGVMLFDFERVWRNPQLKAFFVILSVIFAIFVVFLCFAFSNRLKRAPIVFWLIDRLPFSQKIKSLYDAIMAYGDRKVEFFKAMATGLGAQMCSIFLLYFVGHSLGFSDVSLMTFFIVAPLGFMAIAVPISPAGLGVGQAAFYYLFNLYLGRTTNLGSNAITAFQFFSLVAGLVGGVIYLRYKHEKGNEGGVDIEKINAKGAGI